MRSLMILFAVGQRHDDGQCARTEYPCSDIGLEPTPPEVIAALRAEIAAFDASVTETVQWLTICWSRVD
jgi:hypothetical protein